MKVIKPLNKAHVHFLRQKSTWFHSTYVVISEFNHFLVFCLFMRHIHVNLINQKHTIFYHIMRWPMNCIQPNKMPRHNIIMQSTLIKICGNNNWKHFHFNAFLLCWLLCSLCLFNLEWHVYIVIFLSLINIFHVSF